MGAPSSGRHVAHLGVAEPDEDNVLMRRISPPAAATHQPWRASALTHSLPDWPACLPPARLPVWLSGSSHRVALLPDHGACGADGELLEPVEPLQAALRVGDIRDLAHRHDALLAVPAHAEAPVRAPPVAQVPLPEPRSSRRREDSSKPLSSTAAGACRCHYYCLAACLPAAAPSAPPHSRDPELPAAEGGPNGDVAERQQEGPYG